MKNLTKRVFSLVLALIMCFGIVTVGAETVSAAEVPTVTITPLVTDSVNKQACEVTTNVEAQYSATVGGAAIGSGSIGVGTKTLEFASSDVVTLAVAAPASGVFAIADSTTAYWVDVTCVGDDGKDLGSNRVKLSKFNEPQVVYNAQAVIDKGEFEYHTESPSVLISYGEGDKIIRYTKVAKSSKNVTINYVDDVDAVLYTETKVLNYGDTATISAPATYTKDGSNYALKGIGSYDVTYENVQSTYTFEYAKQAPAAQLPYDITVNLVDENGSKLHTIKKSVDVGTTATVELPATYVVGLKTYVLAEGQVSEIAHDYANAETKTYTVKYVLSGETAAYQVTINLVDQETGKVLDTVIATVEPDGAPFTYDISSKNYIEKSGVTYQVLAGQGNSKGKVVHAYGDTTKTYNLYYAAKLEKNPESYAVSMRYICVNDNKVLSTETQVVKVNSSVTFESAPKTLKVGGKEYILLNGQNGDTVHKYNDAQKSYEIYYRDASIKVENNDIIYVPGTNTDQNETNQGETSQPTVPGGTTDTTVETEESEDQQTTTPGTQNTTPGTTTPGAVTETEEDETAEEPATEESSEEASEATGEVEESEESSAPSEEVEIIEEDEVPLADKPLDAAEDNSSAMPYVIGGIGLLAILVLVILFIVKKRRTA